MFRPLYFLASYPRSGNTWSRLFLMTLLRNKGVVPPAEDLRDLDRYFVWDIVGSLVKEIASKPPEELTAPEMAELRPGMHRWISRRHRFQPYVKTHAFYGAIHGYPTFEHRVFGGAVYLIRNPLDVAPSLAKHFAMDINRAIAVMGRPLYVMPGHNGAAPEPWGSWEINARSWVDQAADKVLVVRYEEMVAEPATHFASMLAHFRIGATSQEIDAATEATSLNRLEWIERQGGFRNPSRKSQQFFGGGARRTFKDKLTPEQARMIIRPRAAMMQRFGYLDDDTLEYAGLSRDEVLSASAR